VRTPPERMRERTFFELLPKGKLLGALSLLVMLVAVLYARRHAGRALEQMQGFFLGTSGSAAPTEPVRRVRMAPTQQRDPERVP
jgi:hypothetical protein